MSLLTALTGSFPPSHKTDTEDAIAASIQNAVRRQVEYGLTVISDGQPRRDIVGIFAHSLGLEGDGLPYHVTGPIKQLQASFTLRDLETAAAAAQGYPLKAHLTGPTLIAESTSAQNEETAPPLPEMYEGDAGFRRLTLDIARALAEEAGAIATRAKELNVQYLQIDEPSFAFGANLELAREAVGIVTEAWKQTGGGETILHVCGDVGNIIPQLAQMPVDILNLENVHLREVNAEARQALRDSGKKLALGVIPVNLADVPSPRRVARELAYAWEDYGPDRVWGITPNCGLRLSEEPLALRRMQCLAQAAREAEELRLELEKWL